MQGLRNEIEKEVINVLKYKSSNSLAANENKTAILIVRRGNVQPNTPEEYMIGKEKIKQSEHENLLGVHIGNDLK